MALSKQGILQLAHQHWGSFRQSRDKAILLERWERGHQYDNDDENSSYHGRPFSPRQSNAGVSAEYDNLSSLAPSTFGGLVVRTLAQTAQVEGIRMPGQRENLKVWETFQRNRWRMRQDAVHRGTIGQGVAYGTVMPGRDPFNGDKLARMRGHSATDMAAWYDGDDDEWPRLAMRGERFEERDPRNGLTAWGWRVWLYDERGVHSIVVNGDGADLNDWEYITFEAHPFKVVPVARCTNFLDLNGNAIGELEPVIPLLRRIDQDVFDRLIVQRFGAWKVRYVAGMAKPSSQEQANIQALKLSIEDILISGDPATKFGTLDASDPKVYSDVTDADLRMLSAVVQMPPHHLLGLSSNLQAEALAEANAGLRRRSSDFRVSAGEFHRQMARMAALVNGDSAESRAWDMQIRWADVESRSLSQAADALGKMAVQMKVPVEMLWERIPGWDDTDVERAKGLVESGDLIDKVIADLMAQGDGDQALEQPNADQG